MRQEVRAALRALAALSLGAAVGYAVRPPEGPVLNAAFLFLYLVVASAGFYIGASLRDLARAGRRIALLGAAFTASAIAGDVAAGLLASLLTALPANLLVAAALGSGWYSFTGPYLATISPVFGVIGLVANQLREDLTLALFPLVYYALGPPSVVMGGATSMDTTLGVVARYAGPELALAGMVQGVALTAAIPVIVPLAAHAPI